MPISAKGLTARQLAIELEYGKPWRAVVNDLLVRHRHWGRVAQRLGVDYATLWRWMREENAEPEPAEPVPA